MRACKSTAIYLRLQAFSALLARRGILNHPTPSLPIPVAVAGGRGAHAFGPCRPQHALAGGACGCVRVQVEFLSWRRPACVWLTGCETSTKLTGLFSRSATTRRRPPRSTRSGRSRRPPARSHGDRRSPQPEPVVNAATPQMLGKDPYDDLSLGKKYFRAGQFRARREAFPQRGRAASARCRSLGRARRVL